MQTQQTGRPQPPGVRLGRLEFILFSYSTTEMSTISRTLRNLRRIGFKVCWTLEFYSRATPLLTHKERNMATRCRYDCSPFGKVNYVNIVN